MIPFFLPFNTPEVSGRGGFSARFSNAIMVYREKKLKNWLTALVGIGYRQRGYSSIKTQSVATSISPNGFISKDIETRLHYLSTDLALRLYFYKQWYLLGTGRFDVLLARKSSEEHQYIIDGMKSIDVSPSIALGKEITVKGYTFLLEYEVNRGVMNISNLPSAVPSAPRPKFWNFTYGINLGVKF
jgi:hypothetical protein